MRVRSLVLTALWAMASGQATLASLINDCPGSVYNVSLYDSYGDGWSGVYIEVTNPLPITPGTTPPW